MVITLDKHKKPVGFTTEKRARQLMERKKACIYKYYPFTIILKEADVRDFETVPTFRIKIDPGSIHTGIAIVGNEDNKVYLYLQIEHRGRQIVKDLNTRKMIRRNRRSHETRYRRCKYKDGGQFTSSRTEGWLAPSVKSIGDNIISWIIKLSKLIYLTDCSFEAVRFDTQLIDNPDIEGKEYQQGTLFGYELKEYLLERYGHICQYCHGESGDDVLEWEHIQPKSKGGTDSVKNAALACHACNQDKGNLTLDEWNQKIQSKSRKTKLDKARLTGIANVKAHKITGVSNRYCAWVSSSRRYVERFLYEWFGQEHMECASGGRTKFNRSRLGLPKDHHYDALCVGNIPEGGYTDLTSGYCLHVKAMGRGNRFRGKINKCGIIIQKLAPREKRVYGFMNGDIVSADIPKGKYKGHHVGKVMTRASGFFDIRTAKGELVTSNYKYCKILQKTDGYTYSLNVCNS